MGKGKVRLVLSVVCLIVAGVFAADPGNVVINEIAWMGTAASSTDEWIELFNTTSGAIDLTDWTLSASDGSPAITLTGTIAAGDYFLMERTNDEPVNDVTADFIYIGSLSNTVEHLILKDADGSIIDEVNPGSEWFAGLASPDYKSMERINPAGSGSSDSNWDSNTGSRINGTDIKGNPIQGTPGQENSVYDASLSVSMSGFSASQCAEGVRLNWETASEVDTRGFYVSRSSERDGIFQRIHTIPIASRGNNAFGARYTFLDYQAPRERINWYHLEELDVFGHIHSLGKLRVMPSPDIIQPETHRLIGNYPNPFNPVTTIAYQIGNEDLGIVDLHIFNCAGQSVRQLVERQQSPGHYVIQWYGKDDAGIDMPSGIYVLRLAVGDVRVASAKLIKSE